MTFLPHSSSWKAKLSWHDGQWDWEGGRRCIDMVTKHILYWQEWKTIESCIFINIISGLHYTVNLSVLSTWEFGICNPDNLGQCFTVRAGPHLKFQLHGKNMKFYFAFCSKLELLKYTPEQKGTGGKDQPEERGTDWNCFNLKLNT